MSLLKTLQSINGKVTEKVARKDEDGGKLYTNSGERAWEFNSDAFFPPLNIDGTRADKIYPYKLLVIDARTNRLVEGQGGSAELEEDFIQTTTDTGGLQFALRNTSKWEFTLPITPQQLSITDQFAINTSSTMRGVVEEHNGVKFKIINASGTTGIWPARNLLEDPDNVKEKQGLNLGIFDNTVEAIQNLSNIASSFDGGNKTPRTYSDKQAPDTGYYQALLLEQFLEQYAMAKKNPLNKNWRLVWHMPKTNESYIVTPMQYTVTRSEKSPQEFFYNMQFKAWKRIELKGVKPLFNRKRKGIDNLDPNFFQQLNQKLDAARSIMSASLNVIKAVRADFRRPFDTLRKVTLLAKDFAGIGVAISDLPNQINKDITSATKKRVKDLTLATGGTPPGGRVVSPLAQNKIAATVALIKEEDDRNEGQSADDIEGGNGGRGARDAQRSSPLNNVFDEPEGNFDFFNLLNVNDLDLTPQQRIAIQNEIELNSLISLEEVKGFIAETQDLILDLSNNFGAGDAFYSQVTGRPAPRERAVDMTIEEFELIAALEEAVLQMNILVSNRNIDDVRTQSPLEYVGGLAEDSDIPFNSTSPSKYLAPVPFGLTIQEISSRYLDNPDRYNEIITLNNLKSPYIDEDGFSYSFLSNGDGRQFNIGSDTNLYVGQKIQLSSATVPMFTRKITSVERVTDTNYLVSVDGAANLNILKSSENANIKAFLPGTINSQNQIYIPSDRPVAQEPRTFDIPFLKDDPLTGISKIDWLLTEGGDVVLNSFGEVSLANGLTNIVQSLKTKIRTPKGTMLEDTNFGLGLVPGINVTEISLEQITRDIRDMVLQDDRFSAVDKVEIVLQPPTISININARLANGRGIFPINFNFNI